MSISAGIWTHDLYNMNLLPITTEPGIPLSFKDVSMKYLLIDKNRIRRNASCPKHKITSSWINEKEAVKAQISLCGGQEFFMDQKNIFYLLNAFDRHLASQPIASDLDVAVRRAMSSTLTSVL